MHFVQIIHFEICKKKTIEFDVSVKRREAVLEIDCSVTSDRKQLSVLKVEFDFEYENIANFMETLKKLSGKIAFLDQNVSTKKRGSKLTMIQIFLHFQLEDKFSWNEHEKSLLKPCENNTPFSMTNCVFGRQLSYSDDMKKYLKFTMNISDSYNNSVLAVLHGVSTFNLRKKGSSSLSLPSGSSLSSLFPLWNPQFQMAQAQPEENPEGTAVVAMRHIEPSDAINGYFGA